MDARSLHEPMVPTDNLQRLTLYAGYTISPKANPVVDRRERTLDTVGNIPGTQYYVDKSDFQYVDWQKLDICYNFNNKSVINLLEFIMILKDEYNVL